MSDICPCCGNPCDPLTAIKAELQMTFRVRGVNLWPQELYILSALYRWDGLVTNSRLIDVLYGDDPDGGPETADVVVKVVVSRIRKKIKKAGLHWTIETFAAQGYRLVRFRKQSVLIDHETDKMKIQAAVLASSNLDWEIRTRIKRPDPKPYQQAIKYLPRKKRVA